MFTVLVNMFCFVEYDVIFWPTRQIIRNILSLSYRPKSNIRQFWFRDFIAIRLSEPSHVYCPRYEWICGSNFLYTFCFVLFFTVWWSTSWVVVRLRFNETFTIRMLRNSILSWKQRLLISIRWAKKIITWNL